MSTFLGYERPDGSVGIRNYVLVVPGGLAATKICDFVAGTRTIITPDLGHGRTARDRAAVARLLSGLARNPNVAAAVYIGHSTGSSYPELNDEVVLAEIGQSGKPVAYIDPIKAGGTVEAVAAGVKAARELVYEASKAQRRPFSAGKLSVGVKCGASDPTSGIAGNPVIGHVYDKIVSLGGTALFGETTEIIGAEQALAKRAVDEQTGQAIVAAADFVDRRALECGEDIRTINPVPENIKAGITTLEEKSLGAVHKAGTAPIQGLLKYAERPPRNGLFFVDNWMSHLSIFAGYAAAGSQLVLYQLGGGGWPGHTLLDPFAGAVAPLLWATANPITYGRARETVDFFSGTVIEGAESVEECGERLFASVLATASGAMTRAETINYQDPIQVYTLDPMF